MLQPDDGFSRVDGFDFFNFVLGEGNEAFETFIDLLQLIGGKSQFLGLRAKFGNGVGQEGLNEIDRRRIGRVRMGIRIVDHHGQSADEILEGRFIGPHGEIEFHIVTGTIGKVDIVAIIIVSLIQGGIDKGRCGSVQFVWLPGATNFCGQRCLIVWQGNRLCIRATAAEQIVTVNFEI